ncbi:hypothetical protein ACIPPM_21995 [Streptomyces sp. NPDC090119]|uniref:hypothetical protein n=1 Tax=Streptomyces sp. NPDC090119 TaxID=3365951 RepID=UPI0037F563D1
MSEPLRAVLTVTVETRKNSDYYFDHDDLLANVIPWIESSLSDRDDIAKVTITAQPPTTEPTLRDRIAEALVDWAYRSTDRKYTALRRDETVRANAYSRADAVLAVLPAPVDRAAVLREAAEVAESFDIDASPQSVAAELRRLGAETLAAEPSADRCDTEFIGGGQCTKPAGHRPPGSDNPCTPRYTADTITDNALDTLYRDLAGLREELGGRDEEARERWVQKQEEQLGIKWADFRAGNWQMDLAAGRDFAAAYVAAARALLGDAPNYSETKLEFDVKIAESPELYTLVVQRHGPGVLTPHEARQRAEGELARVQAAIERVRALHVPMQLEGQAWCNECCVGRTTSLRTAEWVALFPHPCPTLAALGDTE